MPIPTTYFADLVRETSSSAGTGPMALSGALPGHQRFADAVPANVDFCYAIAGITTPAEWEVGIGQIDAQGRLVRASVSTSSAAGALVPFAAGLKTVALTVGASWYSTVGAPPALGDVAGLQAALDAKADDAQLSVFGLSLVDDADAAAARTTLGLGSIATQSAGAVAFTGGTINATTIGATTRAAVSCTTVDASGAIICAAGSAVAAAITPSGDSNTGLFFPAADTVALTSGGTERLRLSATGSVGIGTNAPNKMLEVRASDAALRVSTSSNGVGPQVDVRASPTVGQVGTTSNHNLEFVVNAGPRFVIETGGSVRSGSDNAYALGTASFRWNTIYLGTSPVVTSDERDKLWHGGLNALERAAALDIAAEIGLYQWHDAVAAKGADGARLHCGVRAQAVWAIMARHGLIEPIGRAGRNGGKPGKTPYAFLCWDEWRDPEDRRRKLGRYGVRTDQLTLFVVAALACQRERPEKNAALACQWERPEENAALAAKLDEWP
ncbi:MAG: hypothetical protein ABL874_00370 [Sphingopyxis sp.]